MINLGLGVVELLTGGAALTAVLFGWWQKRRADREKKRADEAEGYRDTRKKLDEVEGDLPRVPADAREWLRNRDK